MYINSVISHLHGWSLLTDKHARIKGELEDIVSNMHLHYSDFNNQEKYHSKLRFAQYDWRQLGLDFSTSLMSKGWAFPPQKGTFDGTKDKIALDFIMGKSQILLSRLFVTYPAVINTNSFELLIFFVLEKELSQIGAASFEQLKAILSEVKPLSINYPFVILGIGNQNKPLEIEELTSEIDQFLIKNIGQSLKDTLFIGENESCEFKESLPPRNESFAKEVCAFANSKNGGLILFGISDNGDIMGIDNSESDKLELKITDIIRNNCTPAPLFKFHKFGISNDKIILVVQILALELKPCMTLEKVFIRVGSTSRCATSQEIRKLILA